MSFENDIRKFAKKAGTNMVNVRKSLFFDLSKQIMERTPVDKGRAIGNWIPSIGKPSRRTTRGNNNFVMARVQNVLKKTRFDDTLYLVNNLPYINKLEYGGYSDGPLTTGGFSNKAPKGMVRVTVAGAMVSLRKAVRGLK